LVKIPRNTFSFVVRQTRGGTIFALYLLTAFAAKSRAQVVPYVGAMGGIATLSADGASQTTSAGLSLSSYAPQNGGALNAFAGLAIHEFVSLQLNYIWNSNDLTLNSVSSDSDAFYQEDRSSKQQAGILDALIYFRPRGSRIRPYLGAGGGFAHLNSKEQRIVSTSGNPPLPRSQFTSTDPVYRAHVGIDFRVAGRLDFRYSFSDTIGKNPISNYLSPPGSRIMENFQNLFGFVVRFR
jgi:hypothetical protein